MPSWTLDDWNFALACLNFGTALLATILVAWTRHGEPERKDTYRVLGLPFVRGYDRRYEEEVYLRDMLTDEDCILLRKIIELGVNFSDRGYHEAVRELGQPYSRPEWNRIRGTIVKMGMGEYGGVNELKVRANLYTFLGMER